MPQFTEYKNNSPTLPCGVRRWLWHDELNCVTLAFEQEQSCRSSSSRNSNRPCPWAINNNNNNKNNSSNSKNNKQLRLFAWWIANMLWEMHKSAKNIAKNSGEKIKMPATFLPQLISTGPPGLPRLGLAGFGQMAHTAWPYANAIVAVVGGTKYGQTWPWAAAAAGAAGAVQGLFKAARIFGWNLQRCHMPHATAQRRDRIVPHMVNWPFHCLFLQLFLLVIVTGW